MLLSRSCVDMQSEPSFQVPVSHRSHSSAAATVATSINSGSTPQPATAAVALSSPSPAATPVCSTADSGPDSRQKMNPSEHTASLGEMVLPFETTPLNGKLRLKPAPYLALPELKENAFQRTSEPLPMVVPTGQAPRVPVQLKAALERPGSDPLPVNPPAHTLHPFAAAAHLRASGSGGTTHRSQQPAPLLSPFSRQKGLQPFEARNESKPEPGSVPRAEPVGNVFNGCSYSYSRAGSAHPCLPRLDSNECYPKEQPSGGDLSKSPHMLCARSSDLQGS